MVSAMRRKWPQLCALYLAAVWPAHLRRRKLAAGERFLTKPVQLAQMTGTVHELWIPTSAAAKIVPYAFQDRQRVIACAFAVPPGPYEITGVLPVADDVPFYRVKSDLDLVATADLSQLGAGAGFKVATSAASAGSKPVIERLRRYPGRSLRPAMLADFVQQWINTGHRLYRLDLHAKLERVRRRLTIGVAVAAEYIRHFRPRPTHGAALQANSTAPRVIGCPGMSPGKRHPLGRTACQ